MVRLSDLPERRQASVPERLMLRLQPTSPGTAWKDDGKQHDAGTVPIPIGKNRFPGRKQHIGVGSPAGLAHGAVVTHGNQP